MLEAEKIQVYGSEFDVYLTNDGVPVVSHAPSINGLKIQDVPFQSVSGAADLLTLIDFLDAAKQTGRIKLILDLKAHPEADVNRASARICVAAVEDRQMQDRVEYLAFSISGGRELVRIAPYAQVYYIGEDLPPAEVKASGFAGLGHDYHIILQRTNVFGEAKDEGMKLNIFTVNDTTLIREMADREVDFITTDYPVEALEIIEMIENKNK